MSTRVDWSDSRTRSRFTTPAGPAETALPLADFRLVLEHLHAATEAQRLADSAAHDQAHIPDRGAGTPSFRGDKRSSLTRRLHEIEAAQQRIAEGSYGVCFGCGQPISPARLKALPCARYCLRCLMQHYCPP